METFSEYDNFILSHNRSFKRYQEIAYQQRYKYLSEMLIDLYFNKKKTGTDIAKIFRSSSAWIYNFFAEIGLVLRPIGITIRPISENDTQLNKDFKLNLNYFKDKLKIANNLGYEFINEAISDMYTTKKMSTKEIGIIFEATPSWTIHILEKLNIKRREPKTKIESRLSKIQINKILKDFETLEIKSDIICNYICLNELNISPKTLIRFLHRQNKEGDTDDSNRFFIQKEQNRRIDRRTRHKNSS